MNVHVCRFGESTFQSEGLDYSKLLQGVKEIRGSNTVTDQVANEAFLIAKELVCVALKD